MAARRDAAMSRSLLVATAAIVLDAGWPLTAGERPGRMPVDDAAVRAALGAFRSQQRSCSPDRFDLQRGRRILVGNYASPR